MQTVCTNLMSMKYKNNGSIATRYSLLLLAVFLSISCVVVKQPGETDLAPVPLAYKYSTYKIDHARKHTSLKDDVPVFIFSNRKLKKSDARQRSVDPYANQRLERASPNLSIAHVSIGKDATEQQIYRGSTSQANVEDIPVTLERVSLEGTAEHVDYKELLGGKVTQRHVRWFKALKKQVGSSQSKIITIYVHGFNTHLISNTELSAKIYHYMGRDGAVVNFDWPSRGRVGYYFQDKGNAENSVLYFRWLITVLAKETGAEKINIIAHSAGCPIVVSAMKELRLTEYLQTKEAIRKKYKINRVILAAPDKDKMTFFNAIFDRFHEVAQRVSVYVFPKDRALFLSKLLFREARLGRDLYSTSRIQRVLLENAKEVEIIDVSESQNIYRSFFGHEYFHKDPWVSSDIVLSLGGLNAEKRGLKRSEKGVFWYFPKTYSEDLKKVMMSKDVPTRGIALDRKPL